MESTNGTTGYNSMSEDFEANIHSSPVGCEVEKRLRGYRDGGRLKKGETQTLMQNSDRDDSDLENNVNRLCQYLSDSEHESDESPEINRRSKFPESSLQPADSLSGPLYALAGHRRAFGNEENRYRPGSGNLRRFSAAFSERSSSSSPSTAPITEETSVNRRYRPLSGSTLETVVMHSGDSTELQQFSPPAGGGAAGYNPRRVGKPVFPQDFLNIPPPAHPPDSSPTLEQRSMPLPPQRQLPPVPAAPNPSPQGLGDEPEYEEAKPPPTAAVLRPQVQKNAYQPRPVIVGMNGYELSNSAAAAARGAGHNHLPTAPVYAPRDGGVYNPDIDWDQCRGTVLERNPETGSFYIPSGHTTMSSLSPQSGRMLEMEQNNKANYSFLPAAGTTVPVSVMPLRPESTGSSGHNQSVKVRNSVPPGKSAGKEKKRTCMRCSWKCLTYSLAALLVFTLAVIIYLLYTLLVDSPIPRSTSVYGVHSNAPCTTGASTLDPVNPLRPLPESFSLGDPVVADLPPAQLVYSYFTLQRDSWVQFNLSVEPQGKLAVYGRQTLPPTPTQHDFVKIILGEKLHAQPEKRSAIDLYGYPEKNLRNTLFVQFLVAGRWNLGFLNDDSQVQSVKFAAALRPNAGVEDCKYGCYGKGVCKDGKCYCFEGFTGPYCEETICPVLCSGNGIFMGGACHCHQGWKGAECDVPDNVCEIPNCNDHGRCNSRGQCDCEHGWTGMFCEQKACPQANCTNHGVCVGGKCFCEFGWKGSACEEAYTAQGLCPESEKCSKHGTWDALSDACRCEIGFAGDFCEIKLCNLDCGAHGRCEQEACVCDQGWGGVQCDSLACLPGCEEHGKCENGTCRCEKGWNGENCQLNGCLNSCNERGECRKIGNNWMCDCSPDFSGQFCSVPLELECGDGRDNDGDGLIDCADSECCNSAQCRNDMMCRSVPDPQTILIREQAPPPQASFLKKVRFLLDSSPPVQQYAEMKLFNETRVSVIQGRVLHPMGGPLKGVRINDKSNALYGFTISRGGGKFDLVVNGGGSVTLQFMRQPFGSVHRTISVPWNSIIVMDDVTMMDDVPSGSLEQLVSACGKRQRQHWLRPHLLPSWRSARHGGPPLRGEGAGKLVADSRTAHESLRLPGTSDLYLSYSSAHAKGHQSALSMYLVPDDPPETLRLVHVKIDVAGLRFEKILVAKPNLTYWFGWDKSNVYKRKVYGLTRAKVAVGYVYSGCEEIFWEKATVKLNGYKSGETDLGGWNLNIHHHFDIHDGVLEKGDGSTVYVNEESPVLATTMGTGRQRPLNCAFCNSATTDVSLFQPLALAAAKDGSLFVGDFNLIRQITPNKTVATVLELSPSDTAHKYYLAIHPVTDELYVSLPLRRQIWKLKSNQEKSTEGSSDTSGNYEVVVGTGKSCVFGEKCGDGGPAKMATLTFPKGLAFDSQGTLYFADERRIRMIRPSGIIQTILGGEGPGSRPWKPLPCLRDFTPEELSLQWPTGVAVDPLSDSLLVLDSDMVFGMKSLDSVRLVVGAPAHCSELQDSLNRTTRATMLKESTGIAVDSEGRILVTESDGKRINRLRSFDIHGRSDLVAGAESNCDCHPQNCPCDESELTLAKDARLHMPEAVTVDAAGLIHIADQGNFKIKSVRPMKPEWDKKTNLYEIYSGESQEVFLFNKFGQHVATKSLLSNDYLYNFTYDVDTSYGRLVRVTGSGSHQLFLRKIASEVQIETSQSRKAIVKLSQFNRMMQSFTGPDGAETKFEYDGNTGLLVSRRNPDGNLRFYNYDDYGHVLSAVSSTGDVIEIQETVFEQQRVSMVTKNGKKETEFRTTDWEIEEKGATDRTTYMLPGLSTFYVNTVGAKAQFDSVIHSLLPPHEKMLLKEKVQILQLEKPARPELTSRLEWRYYLRRGGGGKGKEKKAVIKVNGLNVVAVEHDRKENSDAVLNSAGNPVLKISYNSAGSVTRFQPSSSELAPMNLSMDLLGRISNCTRGDKVMSFVYDGFGRLTEENFGKTRRILRRKFTYESAKTSWPSTVAMPSGAEYMMKYDVNGGLTKVETPSTEEHEFKFLNEMGFGLFLRYTPTSAKPFLIARNDLGKPVSLVYPDSFRRVTFEYGLGDRLEAVWHDQSELKLEYPEGSGNPSRIFYQSGKDLMEKSFIHQGPLLVEEYRIESTKGKRLATGHFSYTHDDLLRVTSIQASFDDQITMEPIQFSYESGTGRMEKLGKFSVKYAASKIRFQGDNVFMDSVIGPSGRITHTSLGIRGRKVCQLFVARDELGRLIGLTGSAAGDKMPETKLAYNVDGNLNQMTIGKQKSHKWTIHYDLDGRVKAVNGKKVDMQSGLVKKFGDLEYETDASGFILGRGSEKYGYDSFGRMTEASQAGALDIGYRYDEQHRLIARRSGKKLFHFYYALPDRPKLITHVYNSVSGMVTVYHYNLHDRLFAMERSGSRFYIQTAPDASPVFIFSDNGNLEKSVLRGPFGEVVQDSAAEFEIFIGFRGMFQDPETGLVIRDGRAMDPLIGRWMSVNVDSLLRPIDLYHPEHLDLLRYGFNEDLTSDLEMDAKDWLELSGLHLDRVVPLLERSGVTSALSHESLCPDTRWVVLGAECNLRKRIGHFQKFLTSETSKILPRTPYPDKNLLQWSVLPSVYGDGVTVTNYSNMAVVQFTLASAEPLLQDAMLVLLNESQIVPVLNLGGLKDRILVEHFFWKQGPNNAYRDLAELGIESEKATLTKNLNVSISRIDGKEGRLVEVRSKVAAVTIYYGDSLEEAREYFADAQLSRTSSSLWRREKLRALNSEKTRFQWSKKEREELRTNGRVEGYIVRRRQETNSLLLAGDSNFLQFEKTLRKRLAT